MYLESLMRNRHNPVYEGERRQHDHIVAAFAIELFRKFPRLPKVPRGQVIGRPVMIWFGIFYLAVVAIFVEAMYRAPELEWHD